MSLSNNNCRILSLNFFLRPPPIRTYWISNHKEARLKLFTETVLDNFDVILLQETFKTGSSRQKRLVKIAYSKGFQYSTSLSPVSFLKTLKVDGGCTILSRFPIVESGMNFYTADAVDVDKFSQKGTLFAKIELSRGIYLFVFTTHMQASYELSQFKEIHDYIKDCQFKYKFNPDTDCCIFGGDVNVDGKGTNEMEVHSEEYLRMLSTLKGSEFEVNDLIFDSLNVHPNTYDTILKPFWAKIFKMDKEQQCLDYLFCFKTKDLKKGKLNKNNLNLSAAESTFFFKDTKVLPFKVENRSFTQISDHFGLTTTLTFT
ncbi:hypothetical protein HDU92_006499 [Lobulomyces angularis]|nr:hypothetical protein HDU92_006499 [Lobulomyces angularis]